jgi:predicted ABC-type ATPase
VKLLKDLKKTGYRIHLFFLWINDIKLALERIELRVRNGGHDIPKDIIHRRFDRSLPNFFRFYQPLADAWAIFDNSKDIPKMIAFEESGTVEIFDQDLYDIILKSKEEQ